MSRFLPSLFLATLLVGPTLLFGSAFDQDARQAAALDGAAREKATDALLDRIQTETTAGADGRLRALWQAFRLVSTTAQKNRLIEIAATVKDNRVRNLLGQFRGSREPFKSASERHTSLLLDGKPVPPKKPARSVFGDNPWDVRFLHERWEDPDGFVNRYQSDDKTLTVDVIADPAGNFRARLHSPSATSAAVDLMGFREGNALHLVGPDVSGVIKNGILTLKAAPASAVALHPAAIARTGWVERPAGALVLLDETTGLKNFSRQDGGDPDWTLLRGGVVEIPPHRGSLRTREEFYDIRLYLEFRVPHNPEALGSMRGNSGVLLMDAYEVQVLDSFGLDPHSTGAGGIYRVSAPSVNMAAPPLQWQSLLIEFTAPRFDAAGVKTASARATVRHNGVKVQDDLEIPFNTIDPKKTEPTAARPLVLQYHANRVQFRNIWVERR